MIDFAYPRLEVEQASTRLGQLAGVAVGELRAHASTSLGGHRFREVSADGRVDEATLLNFQSRVRNIADSLGFPGDLTRTSARSLDQQLSAEILRLLPMTEAEASSNEVWSFLGLMVVPDLTYWRNPEAPNKDVNLERRMGTPSRRTVLQRAWWKAKTLSPEISLLMNEEETVAVMERSFSGFPSLARRFMEEHFSRIEASEESGRQALIRTAAKLLVRRMVVVNVFALNSNALSEVLTKVFDDAEAIIGRRRTAITRVDVEPDVSSVDSENTRKEASGPLAAFRQTVGLELWGHVQEAARPLAFEDVFKLQVAVQAHPLDDADDVELAMRLQYDLLDLLDMCSEFSDEETAVVAAASEYYLLAEDAIPDHDTGGLKDDDLVVSAAYESLGRVRLHGS